MTWMGPESAAPVVVPDVVGLEVSAARKVALQAGIVLVAMDPDGPPLRALTWPGMWTVTAQSLTPGSAMRYRGSLAIECRPGGPSGGPPSTPPPGGSPGDETGDREPSQPKPSPGALSAHRDTDGAGDESGEGPPVGELG